LTRPPVTVPPPPPPDGLPDGFVIRLDPRTERRDGGATLLGGAPLRVVRLSERARDLLSGERLVVRDATTARLAARLLDAGLAHPALPPAQADGDGDLTVVVPVRDRTAALDRLLTAVRADPTTRTAALVVVDDGSADPADVAATAARHSAQVLRHETARGPAAARNAGLRLAGTTTVAFVDSDCVPARGWLGALLPHLADPRVAVVAPRIGPVAVDRPGWVTPYENLASALDLGPHPASVRPFSAVPYVPSAALLARRAAIGAGFDETMHVAEDVDLVWRLAAAGWRIRYEPAARVAHEHPAATAAWLRRRASYGTGAALLAARHGGAVAPLVISPWSAVAWALALTGGRRGLAGAAAALTVATGRLALRLRRPGEPAPVPFAARLVGGGTAAAGRALARTATRHYWPVAVASAVVSRRARRVVLAAAVADAVVAWRPHRPAIGLPRFAAARRLEDLAYGAGLWAGVVRARSARALLPVTPPKI
jgi:mycofactocin system glycosyltransferase